jgi:RecA/RadA recombinase
MIESYLSGINKLIGKGYEEQEIYALYGEPNVGKTTFLIGEIASLISKGYRVVWIDTEGGFKGVWEKWFPLYKTKYGLKDSDDDKFLYHKAFTVEEFVKYLGYNISVEYDKNKINVSLGGKVDEKETIYEKFGKLKGKVAVVVDSFSSPIKLQFTGNVQNFSGRADAESIMLYGLMQYMEKTNAFSIITNHSSKNPTDIFHNNPTMRGGKTIQYYSKHILYWEKPLRKTWADYRKVTAVRTPIARDWELFSWIKINGTAGMSDSSEAELESIK